MSDELALLTAIIAYPEEDTPRLIFADWLEENGQPERAEFIRVQIEIERLPDRQRHTPHYRERLTRFRELIRLHAKAWLKPLGVPQPRALFRRGFVEELRVNADELLAIGDAVLCREMLSSVEVTAPPDDRNKADDDDPPGDAVLRRLAAWPGRGRLRALRVERLALTPPAVEVFLASPPAAGLRSLDVAACDFPARVVRVVAECANLTEVTELRLGYCEVDAADVLALARTPHLKKLHYLMIRVVGEDEPDTPKELRAACRELRARYRDVRSW